MDLKPSLSNSYQKFLVKGCTIFTKFSKTFFISFGIAATISIGREIQCLPTWDSYTVKSAVKMTKSQKY